jgi:hypothetical protein
MPDSVIDGKKPQSLPASVKANIMRGVPKRTAQSMGKASGPKVRV